MFRRVWLTVLLSTMTASTVHAQLVVIDPANLLQAGQTDERLDYAEWAALTQMTDNLRERLRVLSGDEQL